MLSQRKLFPLPAALLAGLRGRLNGQWLPLVVAHEGGGGGGGGCAFTLPHLPLGTEGVAFFDVAGDGGALAPPRPLLILRRVAFRAPTSRRHVARVCPASPAAPPTLPPQEPRGRGGGAADGGQAGRRGGY